MLKALCVGLVILLVGCCLGRAPAFAGCAVGRAGAPAVQADTPRMGQDTQMIDRINGYRLNQSVDIRWQTLFEMFAGDDSYDNMLPGAVFEILFGEASAEADIPRRENCQSMTWGELKNCFSGDSPDYPGNDGPGGGRSQ